MITDEIESDNADKVKIGFPMFHIVQEEKREGNDAHSNCGNDILIQPLVRPDAQRKGRDDKSDAVKAQKNFQGKAWHWCGKQEDKA